MKFLIIRLYLRLRGVQIDSWARVSTFSIGKKTRVWAFVNIMEGAKIGKNCNICDRCFIEKNVIIGNNVTIKTGVSLWSGLIVEDHVFIGPGVQFCNDKYPRSKVYTKPLKTTLRSGCSIGAGATILPGITIGENALIGAGSVVTKDISANAIALGNPAQIKH